jgi:hypothetical protein
MREKKIVAEATVVLAKTPLTPPSPLDPGERGEER